MVSDTVTEVEATVVVQALHYWPNASSWRNYLASDHMHDFRITVRMPVEHGDREIEFHDLRDLIRLQVQKMLHPPMEVESTLRSFGAKSCEHIASALLEGMPTASEIRVFEDEYVGAVLRRRPIGRETIKEFAYLIPEQVDNVEADRIITICGSTRFKEETEKIAQILARDGWLVEMVEFFSQADGVRLTRRAKEKLDEIHKAKIRASDAIYVVNVGGYVGESTLSEVRLAWELNLNIMWLVMPSKGWLESMVWAAQPKVAP